MILQARQIGLSFGDISIVLGIIPIAAGLCNPPIGKISKVILVGDRLIVVLFKLSNIK